MKTLALIDADVLVYSVAASNAKHGGDLEELHWLLQATVDDWTEGAGAEEYYLYATFGPTFRHHFYPEYKQNRKGKPKPRGLEQAREWLRAHPRCVHEDGYEADDLIGLAATCPSEGGSKVIVSTDKDFTQVPLCPRWDPTKDTITTPTEGEALQFRIQQWLCGDSVDGYGGIYRYGPKTFSSDWEEHDLQDMVYTDLSKWVVDRYVEKEYDEEYAQQMLVCSTILTHHLDHEYRCYIRGLVGEMSTSEAVS
jgi:5'-3' exonuclease